MTTDSTPSLLNLPYAYGEPSLFGTIRSQVEDFFVEEILGFEPEGQGEHIYLFVEKVNLNTEQVARQLAQHVGVPQRQVSYSGMKDRRAVTRQWFGVHLPGKQQIDWSALENGQLRILKQARHLKKMRRGIHKANRFVLRVRGLSGDVQSLVERAQQITRTGVPNYFGEQRFGRGGDNINQAWRWFAGDFKPRRHQQGIYLSAVRAYLFNAVLAKRIIEGNWLHALQGELLMLAGSHSLFSLAEQDRQDIDERLKQGDVHPTGPLFGSSGKLTPLGLAQIFESEVLADYSAFTSGLERLGAKADRRALRVLPEKFSYQIEPDYVELVFSLPRGCFATAVMRELLHYRVASTDVV